MAGLFGGGSQPQPVAPPVVTPPPVMPVPDDAADKRKKQMSVMSNAAQRGRQSTVLTPDAGVDTLGG